MGCQTPAAPRDRIDGVIWRASCIAARAVHLPHPSVPWYSGDPAFRIASSAPLWSDPLDTQVREPVARIFVFAPPYDVRRGFITRPASRGQGPNRQQSRGRAPGDPMSDADVEPTP
jgi:hypothetical protein